MGFKSGFEGLTYLARVSVLDLATPFFTYIIREPDHLDQYRD